MVVCAETKHTECKSRSTEPPRWWRDEEMRKQAVSVCLWCSCANDCSAGRLNKHKSESEMGHQTTAPDTDSKVAFGII